MRAVIGAVVLAAAALAACSTPYQDMGFTGGVRAEQMTATTYRISARGNTWTSKTSVRDYVMLKAAETTVASGNTHFVIVGAEDASRTSTYVTGGIAETSYHSGGATTIYSPPRIETDFKPGQDVYIRVLTIPDGRQPPAGMVAADEIIQFIGARVKQK